MAHDYDDNVLLDSDEEGARTKKTKDFIPKPRLLTAPDSKLAAIAGQSSNQVEDGHQHTDSHSSNEPNGSSSQRNDYIEPPAADTETKAMSSSDTNSNDVQRISVHFKESEHSQVSWTGLIFR